MGVEGVSFLRPYLKIGIIATTLSIHLEQIYYNTFHFGQLQFKLEPLFRSMTARYTAAAIGGRIIAERIPDGCIGSTFKTGCIQANEMIGGQFYRIVAFGTE